MLHVFPSENPRLRLKPWTALFSQENPSLCLPGLNSACDSLVSPREPEALSPRSEARHSLTSQREPEAWSPRSKACHSLVRT